MPRGHGGSAPQSHYRYAGTQYASEHFPMGKRKGFGPFWGLTANY